MRFAFQLHANRETRKVIKTCLLFENDEAGRESCCSKLICSIVSVDRLVVHGMLHRDIAKYLWPAPEEAAPFWDKVKTQP